MPVEKTIQDLPDEILVKVFSLLSFEDIVLGVQYVSNRWSQVSQDSKIWNKLSYRPRSNTPETDVINILKQAPKLQMFHPFGFLKVDVLEAIITNCKDIREVELYFDHMPLHLIERLAAECPNINALSVVEISFGERQWFSVISKFKKLRMLRLCGNVPPEIKNVFRDIADGCPGLEVLDIRNLYDFSNSDFHYLLQKRKDKLTSLYVGWSKEDDKAILPVVECCSKLEALHIEEYNDVEPSKGFASLKKMHNLKILCMPFFRRCNVSYMIDLFRTAPFENLLKLDLSVYEQFENSLAWAIFEKCFKLKYLKLVYCPKLTDEGLKPIYRLSHLERLWLSGCNNITDDGVLHVVKCSKLKYLNLNNCCGLTSKSFVHCCQNLVLLQELLVNRCCIGEQADLALLGLLKHLKFLDICVQGFESNNLIALRKALCHLNLHVTEGNDN